MKIDDEHKLPCDFIVGHIRFRKGVKLETVRQAAERWFTTANAALNVSGARYRLDDLLKGVTEDNLHPAVEP